MAQQIDKLLIQRTNELQNCNNGSQTSLRQNSEALKLLELYNPSMQVKYTKNETRCIMGKAPTLLDVRRTYGQDVPIVWLTIQLSDLNEEKETKDEYKKGRKELEDIANRIYAKYKFLKLPEFMIVFQNLKDTNFYGRITRHVIIDAIKQYLQHRATLIEAYDNEQRQKQYKEQAKNAMTYEEWQEIKMLTRMYEMQVNTKI